MPALDYWDQYAKDHLTQYNGEMSKFIRDLVVSLRVQSVLEIGCSAGNDLKLFPDEMNVNGIDTSDMAITLAKENLPKFSFKTGNITSIPFGSDSIDLVFTRNLFNYVDVQDIKKAIDELFRVSKKYIFNIELFSENEETINDNPDMHYRNMKKHWLDHRVKIISNVDMHEEIDPKKSRFTLLRKM
ncbi:class I SAM-dependent methyltransferase [Candidatus Nitrosotenuis cloacae]|uniref:Methyltransferase type 11 n=1 Tax=Candidatus Nitrosotenuis cloacae TaxID=1603555 RepID=A0A3G1B2X8_9ARCH|nr:class I SAM-dependent methyltransferase [Candidatus Nitrosotenuis cloacae]AJZ76224.1 methyltransferase type 11 [Candidatus Nitrosotenuis cloacae]